MYRRLCFVMFFSVVLSACGVQDDEEPGIAAATPGDTGNTGENTTAASGTRAPSAAIGEAILSAEITDSLWVENDQGELDDGSYTRFLPNGAEVSYEDQMNSGSNPQNCFSEFTTAAWFPISGGEYQRGASFKNTADFTIGVNRNDEFYGDQRATLEIIDGELNFTTLGEDGFFPNSTRIFVPAVGIVATDIVICN